MAMRLSLAVACVFALLLCSLSPCASHEYFRDDFSPAGPDDKYFFEGTLGDKLFGYAEGGVYRIDTTRSFDYGHSVLLHDLSTYELEARGALVGDTAPKLIEGRPVKAGWGITFNYTEDATGRESFLLALINPAERTFVLRRIGGEDFTNLLGPFACEAIHSGANVLRVKVDAGRVEAYVNGEQVGSVFEPSLLAGGFGLYVTPRTIGEFDYISVRTEAVPVSVVHDDFGGSPARWFTGDQDGVTYSYGNGAYIIDATGGPMTGISPFPGEHVDFEMEVSVRKLSGPDNFGFGFFFQDFPIETGGFDHFRFLISNDGWFTVQRSFEDLPRALFQWAESDRILPDTQNRLRVFMLNGQLSLFINDYLVYELTDLPGAAGKLGLYVSAGVSAAFDDFTLADF